MILLAWFLVGVVLAWFIHLGLEVARAGETLQPELGACPVCDRKPSDRETSLALCRAWGHQWVIAELQPVLQPFTLCHRCGHIDTEPKR